MAGDLTFPNATITVHVAAVNVYGNPAEVSQRLDQIVSAVHSLQDQGVKIMANEQELADALNELGTHMDAIQSAVNNAEARLTAEIKKGASGAALQAVVDSALGKVKELTGKAQAAADDLNDGTDEADTPPDDGGGTPPDDGGTPPVDGGTLRRG